MRKIKNYNVTILRGGEIVKEIHSNDSLYCWKQIQKHFYDSYGNVYLDRQYDTLHITFGENDEERDLDEIREACWRNGHFSVK